MLVRIMLRPHYVSIVFDFCAKSSGTVEVKTNTNTLTYLYSRVHGAQELSNL